MFCTKCGGKLSDDASVCKFCGEIIIKDFNNNSKAIQQIKDVKEAKSDFTDNESVVASIDDVEKKQHSYSSESNAQSELSICANQTGYTNSEENNTDSMIITISAYNGDAIPFIRCIRKYINCSFEEAKGIYEYIKTTPYSCDVPKNIAGDFKTELYQLGICSELSECKISMSHQQSKPKENITFEATSSNDAFKSEIHLSKFDKFVIKANSILDFLGAILLFILGKRIIADGVFWEKIIGVAVFGWALYKGYDGIRRITNKFDYSKLTRESFKDERKSFFIDIPVAIAIIVIILNLSSNVPIIYVKEMSFENFGSETIGELLEENIKGLTWSYEEEYPDVYLVVAEGFWNDISADVQFIFYCIIEDDGSYEVRLDDIIVDNENSGLLGTAIVWALLYD